MSEAQRFLRQLFDTAVAAAAPANCMPQWLPQRPPGRVVVVGAGKAAASMAKVLEYEWGLPLEGRVVVPHGYAGNAPHSIDVIEAAHPLPDAAGIAATTTILDCVSDASSEDTVVCLISGGGSSLLCLPAEGVNLAEKQDITRQLLHCGAAIHEINCVRKKLSAVKGGKLALACQPAKLLTLLISDVPGNDIASIASGPTVSDTNSAAEALEIIDRYEIDLAPQLRRIVASSSPAWISDSDVRILATSDDALLAAATLAAEQHITPYSLGDLSSDARQLGIEHAKLVREQVAGRGPIAAPCVILSGGETTLAVHGGGRGGRNGEYALSLAIALDGLPNVNAIACDTDGIDGSGDNAGCFVAPDTLQRATAAGLDMEDVQRRNDSYRFFEALDDLIVTGPTYTNVNDFRAIFIDELKE